MSVKEGTSALSAERSTRADVLRLLNAGECQADLPEGHGKLAEAEAVPQKALAQEIGNPPQLWKTYQALGELYERQGATAQARLAYASAIEVIEEVASRLQDQELKRVFLSARPVQEIRERLMACGL